LCECSKEARSDGVSPQIVHIAIVVGTTLLVVLPTALWRRETQRMRLSLIVGSDSECSE